MKRISKSIQRVRRREREEEEAAMADIQLNDVCKRYADGFAEASPDAALVEEERSHAAG
jgi:hypothetical protein